jgi:hypothetical protein
VLLKENLSALSITIPLQQLPKIFADAMEITRKLEVDYIWIDSLCIVQDDEDDWRGETAVMEHIYGGSYLNIAASSATSVHGGCLGENYGVCSAFRTKVRVGDDELVREIRDDECYDRAVWGSHLATRAWALQEKLLPPRTLHLGDRGAFWECRLQIANEYLPDGFTQRLGSGLLRRIGKKEHLQQWWAEVVRLFTNADLTFARDKLPALSGTLRASGETRESRHSYVGVSKALGYVRQRGVHRVGHGLRLTARSRTCLPSPASVTIRMPTSWMLG